MDPEETLKNAESFLSQDSLGDALEACERYIEWRVGKQGFEPTNGDQRCRLLLSMVLDKAATELAIFTNWARMMKMEEPTVQGERKGGRN
jgi:hypothetical protein